MLLALIASGCASMVNGRYQEVPVDSFPSGAKVAVNCGDISHDGGTTPATIKLQRGAEHCAIVLTKDGYAARKIEFDHVLSRATNGNKISGFVFGVVGAVGAAFINLDAIDDAYKTGYRIGKAPGDVIDDYTGGAYKLAPAKVFVTLVRLEQAPPQ